MNRSTIFTNRCVGLFRVDVNQFALRNSIVRTIGCGISGSLSLREKPFFTHNFCLTKWFLSTRLETRTRESNVRASIMVRKTMMHYESTTVVAS